MSSSKLMPGLCLEQNT